VYLTFYSTTYVTTSPKAIILEQVTQWSPWRRRNKHRNM